MKFEIKVQIETKDKIETSDMRAMLKGCKFLTLDGTYFYEVIEWKEMK